MGLEHLRQIADAAMEKSQGKRAEKKAKGNPTAWRVAWQDSMREFYPEAVVGYTTTDANNLKQAVNRGIPTHEVAQLIEWAVKNWELVRRKISNTDKAIGPPVPDMRYFIYQIGRIHTAFRQNRDAATIDLSKRRQSVQTAASAEPDTAASQARKPLPRIPLAHKPVSRSAPLPRRPAPTPQQTADLQQRLGLPSFEEARRSR